MNYEYEFYWSDTTPRIKGVNEDIGIIELFLSAWQGIDDLLEYLNVVLNKETNHEEYRDLMYEGLYVTIIFVENTKLYLEKDYAEAKNHTDYLRTNEIRIVDFIDMVEKWKVFKSKRP